MHVEGVLEAQHKFESSVSPSMMAEVMTQTSPVNNMIMEMYDKSLLGELVEQRENDDQHNKMSKV